jgi:hypothetical protein
MALAGFVDGIGWRASRGSLFQVCWISDGNAKISDEVSRWQGSGSHCALLKEAIGLRWRRLWMKRRLLRGDLGDGRGACCACESSATDMCWPADGPGQDVGSSSRTGWVVGGVDAGTPGAPRSPLRAEPEAVGDSPATVRNQQRPTSLF